MKHHSTIPIPLLTALSGCLFGLVWQEYSAIKDPLILLALFAASLPLSIHAYFSHKNELRISSTFFLCMLGAACLYQTPHYALEQLVEKYKGQPITLCGTIQDVREEHYTKTVTLHSVEIQKHGKSEKPCWFTKALVQIPRSNPTPSGARMFISHQYISAHPETLAFYQLKEHLLGCYFPQKNDVTLGNTPLPSSQNPTTPQKESPAPTGWTYFQKERLNRSINDVFSLATQNMIKSVFIGDSQVLNSETRSLFERWGISHYLARSGLHLILLATLLIFILNACGLPFFATRGAALAFSIMYHVLTTPSTSFMRAFSMNIMIGAALLLGTTPTMLHLFSVVTLMTLLANPFTLFSLDFQLSFGISGALILLFSIVKKTEKNISKTH